MAKFPAKKSDLDAIELHPDAWQRFEKFVDTKVRTTAAPTKRKPSRPKATTAKPGRKA
jgi:hypothetical protein